MEFSNQERANIGTLCREHFDISDIHGFNGTIRCNVFLEFRLLLARKLIALDYDARRP